MESSASRSYVNGDRPKVRGFAVTSSRKVMAMEVMGWVVRSVALLRHPQANESRRDGQ